MTRRGKIARLPRDIREQLNRRLQNGEPGKELVPWLNSLPEVKASLSTEFKNETIHPQNLSEWKVGGYQDWLLQQEKIDRVRSMQADSVELTEAAKTTLPDFLAQRLAAQFVTLAQRIDRSTADGQLEPKLLHEVCADIVALRKGEHSAERLKLARDRLNFDHELDTRDLEKVARKWAEEHDFDLLPKSRLSLDEQARRLWDILETDGDYDEYQEWLQRRKASAQPSHIPGQQDQDPAATSSDTTEQPQDPPPAESQYDPTE
jgi:hypothetical protein